MVLFVRILLSILFVLFIQFTIPCLLSHSIYNILTYYKSLSKCFTVSATYSKLQYCLLYTISSTIFLTLHHLLHRTISIDTFILSFQLVSYACCVLLNFVAFFYASSSQFQDRDGATRNDKRQQWPRFSHQGAKLEPKLKS